MRMRFKSIALLLGLFFAPLLSGTVAAAEIHVMSSGGLTAAFRALAPRFEAKTGHKVDLVLGPSMGTSPEAIPIRLERGEPADLLLMVGYSLADLAKAGKVAPDTVDLAESRIGLAVRSDAPVPDIKTLEAFKRTLLSAPSIAYSDSASGVYVEREMYRKLGLHAELAPKSRMIVAERVGNVVARGEAAVGFQQMSELLPVKGIAVVGPIPEEVQSVTVFSAGIPAAARERDAARELLAFLASPEAAAVIRESGMDPIQGR
jgi:molybdate transport system substrate-binding protein